MTRSPNGHAVVRLTIDGIARDARQDERLVDVITRVVNVEALSPWSQTVLR